MVRRDIGTTLPRSAHRHWLTTTLVGIPLGCYAIQPRSDRTFVAMYGPLERPQRGRTYSSFHQNC